MVRKRAIILLLISVQYVLSDFNLTIVHITDLHSHWFEFDDNKGECSEEESNQGKCFGGFPRLISFIRDIRKREKNVLVLSSGDFFLGRSLHSLHGWKPAHALLPRLELDAMSLSNHDFDSGIFELSAFLYAMKFPVLCANMWARKTSFLYSRVNKSAILEVGGHRVGIVGYIHRHALKKSRSAVSVLFLPEIPALQEEVRRLEDEESVDKIIALGHAGYYTDLKIAEEVKGVDIVMGGDSDIMLFDPGDDESAKIGNIHGNYPRVHEHQSDDPSLANRTLVLHIPQHGKYIGVLRATFDDQGKIIHESGEPVLLDSSIPQDQETLEFMHFAKGALEQIHEHSRLPENSEILANVLGWLDGEPRSCRMRECTLGNFVADAILHEFTFHYRNGSEHRSDHEKWGPIDAVVMNSGNIIRSIEAGDITIQDVLRSVLLGGFIERVYISGQQLLDMMEHSVRHYDPRGVTPPGAFLQIAGLRVEYDMSKAPGRRVRSLQIRCRDCLDKDVQMYNSIKPYKTYVIGMPSFLMHGGDGYQEFEERDKYDFGQFDAELIVEYLRRIFFIEPVLDGRIQLYNLNATVSETWMSGTKLTTSPQTDSQIVYNQPASKTSNLQNATANVTVTSVSEKHGKNVTPAESTGSKNNFTDPSINVSGENKKLKTVTISTNVSDASTQSVQKNISKQKEKSILYGVKYFEDNQTEINENLKDLDASYNYLEDTYKSQVKGLSKEERGKTENNESILTNSLEFEAERSPSIILSSRLIASDETNDIDVQRTVRNLPSPASISSTTYRNLEQVSNVGENRNISHDDASGNRNINFKVTVDRRSMNQTRQEVINTLTLLEQSEFINHFENFINNILKTFVPFLKDRAKVTNNSVNTPPHNQKVNEKNIHKGHQELLNQTALNFSMDIKEILLMDLAKLFARDLYPPKTDGIDGNGTLLEKLPEFLQNLWKNISFFLKDVQF